MKRVVISGFSGGMGNETAKLFANNGYFVYGLDYKYPAEEIPNSKFIKTDLTDEKSIAGAYEIIAKDCDGIDLLINMAGIYDFDSLIEISEERFKRIFDINVFAVYRMNKTFLPLLKKKGKIIIVSSELAPLDPLPFTGLYGLGKTTIEKYAYSLRMELQLLDYQVVVIRPGAVATPLLNNTTSKIDNFTKNTELYKDMAQNYKNIVDSVESKTIPPSKIAKLAYKISNKKKPKYVYNINRNFLLRLLSFLPDRFQNWIIKKLLIKKRQR